MGEYHQGQVDHQGPASDTGDEQAKQEGDHDAGDDPRDRPLQIGAVPDHRGERYGHGGDDAGDQAVQAKGGAGGDTPGSQVRQAGVSEASRTS